MVSYSIVDDKDEWNSSILKYENHSPYQLYEWGIYKSEFGWVPLRIKATDGKNEAFLQICYKKKSFLFLGWIIGSISGEIHLFNKSDLIQFIKDKIGVHIIYMRSSFINMLNFNQSLSLYSSGWFKCLRKMNSDYSIYLDLSKELNSLENNLSSNWRRNLKRGRKKNENIQVKYLKECSVKEISCVFSDFNKIKSVKLPDADELEIIKLHLGDNIIVTFSYINNIVVGLRAFLFHGTKAIDFWAATGELGRKNYTSHTLLFSLFEKSIELGLDNYDMSGIDPVNNSTVFSFKNGLRGNIFEKLGEWEISNNKSLAFVVNKVFFK